MKVVAVEVDNFAADGNISPEEEKELEKLSIIITEQGEAEAGSIAEKVNESINRTKQSITDFFSTKDEVEFSEDSLFERLRQLDEKNLCSLLFSGLKIPEKNVQDLGKEELILKCSKELRSAAGSSCRNLFRNNGHEFPYKQILIDVADRLADGFTPLSWTKCKLDDFHAEGEIEDTILNVFDERARKWWEKLSEKRKAEFVDGLQKVLEGEAIDEVIQSGGVKTVLIQQGLDNAFQYGVTWGLTKFLAPGLLGTLGVSIVGHIGWLVIVQTLGFMTGIKIAILGIGGMGVFGGAVSLLGATAVGGVLSIPSTLLVLDGAAYRKTIPTVIMLLTMCRAKSDCGSSLQVCCNQK